VAVFSCHSGKIDGAMGKAKESEPNANKGGTNMTDTTADKELAALKDDIASLREQIAALAAGLKTAAKPAGAKDEGARRAENGEVYDDGQESHGPWVDLLRKFDSSRVQGEKVVRGLAAEVEHHPLVSVMAAFGLGYIIAKLWFEEDKK
jgi:hypothetical protein